MAIDDRSAGPAGCGLHCGLLMMALLLLSPAARAQSAEEFYPGKQLSMIIYSSAGGTYDTYARLLSRHMPKHIPGNPQFIPRNMPGAGGITAARFIYVTAPKDGLTLGTVGRGLPFEPMLGGSKAFDFDPLKFTWIGSMNKESSVAVSWHTSAVKVARDLFDKDLLTAATTAGSDSQIIPEALNGLLGTRFKIISGYQTPAAVALALERGEVEGFAYWGWVPLKSEKADWLREKKINLLFQTALQPHPELPDVPLVTSLARSEEEKECLELLFSRDVIGRPFLAPPGIPADRAATLRRAFDASMVDPALLDEAEKARIEINPANAAEVESLLRRVMAFPPAVIERTKKAMGR